MTFNELLCNDLMNEFKLPKKKGHIKIEILDQKQRKEDIYPFLFRVTYYGNGFNSIASKTICWSWNDIMNYVRGINTHRIFAYRITTEYIKNTINEMLCM